MFKYFSISGIRHFCNSNEDQDFPRTSLDIGLLLCVPFAASIGGTGTFTGTDLNLYLAGFYRDYFKDYIEDGSGFQG